MAEYTVIKSYEDSELSGTPIIIGTIDAYFKAYPTIGSPTGSSGDLFPTDVLAYYDAALSGALNAIQVSSDKTTYFIRVYTILQAGEIAQTGLVATNKSIQSVYLLGMPRIGVLYVSGTPYYFKMYPTMVNIALYELLSRANRSGDNQYIPLIKVPTLGKFPTILANGTIQNSVYGPEDFALVAHDHDDRYAFYFHEHPNYSLTSHNHDSRYLMSGRILPEYALINHNHAGIYAAYTHSHSEYSLTTHNHNDLYAPKLDYSLSTHNHDGVYDPVGLATEEAIRKVTQHETAYNHANYDSAFGWGNHANAGYSKVGHVHTQYSLTTHTHPTLVSQTDLSNHVAAANPHVVYSLTTHAHPSLYSVLGHSHSEYSLTSHSHDGVYSPVSHNHTGVYSAINHDHALSYVNWTYFNSWAGASQLTTLGAVTSVSSIKINHPRRTTPVPDGEGSFNYLDIMISGAVNSSSGTIRNRTIQSYVSINDENSINYASDPTKYSFATAVYGYATGANRLNIGLEGYGYSQTLNGVQIPGYGYGVYGQGNWAGVVANTIGGWDFYSSGLGYGSYIGGKLFVGTQTGSNILTVQQNSATDPIADSWTVYPCGRQTKTIEEISSENDPYEKIKSVKTYPWKRKELDLPDEEIVIPDGLGGAKTIMRKHPKRGHLKKYQQTRMGIMIDDPDIPEEILTLNEDGTKAGIDLLGYAGYLHTALQKTIQKLEEEIENRKRLESLITGIPIQESIPKEPGKIKKFISSIFTKKATEEVTNG
jgi:hypothetical protein